LLSDGRFDASPQGMRRLIYVEKEGFKYFEAEELKNEFYDPMAVKKVLKKYTQ